VHFGAHVFPEMFSLAQTQQAYDAVGGIANPQLASWFTRNLVTLMDPVAAAKRYPCAKVACSK
jgi:hypothetical protein